MNRIFLLTLGCAALAITITHGAAQSSSPGTTRTAIFAGGCFWCIQPAFDKAKGVIKTVVGYSGGTEPNPTYELVTSEKTNYRESIEVTYDSAKISYDNCWTSTGARLIRPKPTASSPMSARVIAPRFFMTTLRRRKSPKLQKRSSRTPANSINQSSLKF